MIEYKFNKSLLSPPEIISLAEGFLSVVEPPLGGDPFLGRVIAKVKSSKLTLEQALTREIIYAYRKELKEADDNFSESFLHFRKMTRIRSQFIVSPTESNAALDILNILKKHGENIDRMGRYKQIGYTNALILELDKAENKAKLNAAGISEIYADIKSKHQILKDAYKKTVQQETDNKKLPEVKDSSGKLALYLEVMYSTVYDHALMEETNYLEPIKGLNTVFENLLPPARARKTRGGQKESEDKQEPEDENRQDSDNENRDAQEINNE